MVVIGCARASPGRNRALHASTRTSSERPLFPGAPAEVAEVNRWRIIARRSTQAQLHLLHSWLDINRDRGLELPGAFFRARGDFRRPGRPRIERYQLAAAARHLGPADRNDHLVVEVP